MWDGWHQLQVDLGVKFSHMLAGTAGGIVRGFMIGSGFYAAVSSVIVGLMTATYMTTPISLAVGKAYGRQLDANFEHGVAFIIGISGMLICEGAFRYVRDWLKAHRFTSGGK